MSSKKPRASDIKLQTTQNLVGKAMIPTLRLFDMLLSSKKSSLTWRRQNSYAATSWNLRNVCFTTCPSRDGNRLSNPRRTSSLSVFVQLRVHPKTYLEVIWAAKWKMSQRQRNLHKRFQTVTMVENTKYRNPPRVKEESPSLVLKSRTLFWGNKTVSTRKRRRWR